MENYVRLAVRTESPPNMTLIGRAGDKVRELHAILGLMTELGELADPLKRHIFYGATAPLRTNVKEELGDLLWYIAVMCDVHGLSIGDVMQANIQKLATRYPEKFDGERAVNRDLAAERTVLEGA